MTNQNNFTPPNSPDNQGQPGQYQGQQYQGQKYQGQAQPGQQYQGQQYQGQPDQPKKKNWFARHKVLTGIGIAVIVIGLFAAIGGGGGSSDDEPAADPVAAENQDAGAPAEEAAPAEEDAAEEAAPAEEESNAAASIGDAVTSGDLEFTITGVENGGTEVGSEYLNKTAQGEYFFVHVSVTNTGNEAVSFFGSNQKLVDSQGRQHETDSSASLYMEDNDTLFTEINPGNTVDGTLVFDIPADAEPVEVIVQDGMFDDEVPVNIAGGSSEG
ncbi:DUF4352 domain-containing protein [Gulosibacter molinativorax]|uniref:DUF4352 domain-containing protein n=1 Tax=Gulosibacter molinativorax TaxID=256821 RepID=A0ABT7CAY7_9MICO|nr:DUF4352 domain-containing protein [Gulosibacter molinativorax]MDJ1372253.1 DUF4352 domain-containing protein [Gulosibacter molinativorax]QUY63463.1 Mpr protein [Gulosibacter molinativorax]